ncbi:protein-N(pi)-phosphohistidine-sugar phosphotransferase (phosphotransferase system mannose /fructose-specific IIA component) [Canicola haemoglobinophilus]|uniref:PTS system mannose-specific EIIAB component n=1 Tax=Canicola haemoglobinophilus TaxID=733 RepID=A0AB38H8A2_9PAST|nr:PTS mannose transporter subunit IIAB [Canicola haemoglobinophilus]STO55532.1 protein-N(pi)-phosphohistidine-sugar phosphotransferase (phosphotransferase system mannose /fructose-specific IIA component) [Canicola haemoglobinophilus]STO67859.1 protein-N(pi)-phosphohistidine-sugar phosphotransferase (phosphotransferase system mannose /fructose-specific IIA component) [Canicola haemoglobinophilus]
MSIAIIIATHGVATEQLLKTTEMLIGEQENVATIDFVPGENAETIITKYQEKLSTTLAHCDEVLFLVDTWGGSPFNAANRVIGDNTNMDIVTGVNVPMLVETFMARDDGPSLQELVNIALETGRTGVRALKYEEEPAQEEKAVETAPAAAQPQVAVAQQEGNLIVGLARIDDRLIHGQVATRWTKESRVSRIVVVNDDVAKDEVRSTMLKSVAPPGVTAHVVNVEKMIRVYNNPEYANERMMLLFTNPTDVLRLLEAGVDMKSINVGGMAYKDGKKMITSAVSVDDKDIAAFKAIDAMGVELDVRKVSNDAHQYMMDLLKKNNLI